MRGANAIIGSTPRKVDGGYMDSSQDRGLNVGIAVVMSEEANGLGVSSN